MPMSLLIYAESMPSRLRYVAHVIFDVILGIPYDLTSDEHEFETYQGPRLNYSSQEFLEVLKICPAPLLFETGFVPHEPEFLGKEHGYGLYPTRGNLVFDPFAAAFYLLSRYEEYGDFEEDTYGRFPATASHAFRHGYLEEPVVDQWAQQLSELLKEKYPALNFGTKTFRIVPTIDIDNAYAYLGKAWWRGLGGLAKSMLKGDWITAKQRWKVCSGKEKDPYDTYEYMVGWIRKSGNRGIVFCLVGDYHRYDKNIPAHHPLYQKAVSQMAEVADIGLHPSFYSNRHPEVLTREKQRVEALSATRVIQSRQHFLILRFPETYHQLIDLGITDDYSMGYASHSGFRAGTCTPFPFYDLDKEQMTSLTLHPFAFMEATYQYYQPKSPEEVLSHVDRLKEKIKAVNGTFYAIWHNESLSDQGAWRGWRVVFEYLLQG